MIFSRTVSQMYWLPYLFIFPNVLDKWNSFASNIITTQSGHSATLKYFSVGKKKQSRTRPTDLNLTSLLANLWIYLQKMSIKRAQHSCLSYPLCTISTKHLHLVNHVCPLIKLLWQITYLFSSFKSLKLLIAIETEHKAAHLYSLATTTTIVLYMVYCYTYRPT